MSELESSRRQQTEDAKPRNASRRFAWWEWFDLLELFSYVLMIFFE